MKTIKNNWKLLKYALRYTPQFVFLTMLDALFLGVLNSYVTVIFLKIIFDQIQAGAAFKELMGSAAQLLLFLVAGYVFHVLYMHLFEPQCKYKLHAAVQGDLFEKLPKVELACYDDPTYYDNFIWIMNEADEQIYSLVKDIGTLLNRVISVGTITALLSTVDWMIAACILVSVTFSLFLKHLQTKTEYDCEKEIRIQDRKEDYLNNLYISKDYAKEIHATDVSSIIDRELDDVVSKKKDIFRKNGRKRFWIHLGFDIFSTTFFNIGILLLLLYRIQVSKSISLGDFVAAAGSSWKLFWQFNSFADVIGRFQKRDLYSRRFQEFMGKKGDSSKGLSARKMPQGNLKLSFCNVSFRYPGSERWILRNISFQIEPCEKIAIVGYNGAGKTTLVRLIMRLYDPTEGMILLNGFDIREYDIDEYRSIFSTIFQNFKLYAFSAAENVLMRTYTAGQDDEKIRTALEKCGILDKIDSYPNGIHSRMTKEFDEGGIELSGGQSQKMALARAFAHEADVVILDEPTSALDPISEYEMCKSMLELSAERTCIVISHRLAITKDMEWILLLEKGRIVEKGSHAELLKENGRYAEMWKVQTKDIL
ncbi:MAG: ABC transporter ATP-binding protein/permease [Acetatifactor sp.]|nr:ABC transporter ATP-binding protein/permease [Acetatifactor sp.]